MTCEELAERTVFSRPAILVGSPAMRLLPPALALALAATAGPALGASWTAPAPLQVGSRGPFPFFQATSAPVRNEVLADIDAAGNAFVTWSQPSYAGASGPTPRRIMTVVRPARGAWGPLEYLGGAGRAPGNGLPDMDVNDAGDAIAVWDDGSAYRLSGDPRWSNALTLPDDLACDGGSPCTSRRRVAIDGTGAATMVYRNTSGFIAFADVRRASTAWVGGTLSPPGVGSPGWNPDVAMDANRQVVAVWRQEAATPSGYTVVARRRLAMAGVVGWEDAVATLGEADPIAAPRIAIGANGDVAAVWEAPRDGGGIEVRAAVRRWPSGGWQTRTVGLAQTGRNTDPAALPGPAVGVDGSGNVAVAWQQYTGGASRIVWSVLPSGGSSFPAPQTLAGPVGGPGVYGPTLSVTPAGTAALSSGLGTFLGTTTGGWSQQPPVAGVTERSAAISAAGFAVRAGQTDGTPVNEIDQPASGRWLLVTGSVLDPDLPDRDGDGVPDASDGCPDTPGTAANGGCAPGGVVTVTPPVCPPDCGASFSRIAIGARWPRGRMVGTLTIRGRSEGAGTATVVVDPPPSRVWGSRPRFFGVSLPAGQFTTTIRLRGAYPPGVYSVSVLNARNRTLLSSRRVVVRGPRNGVVADRFMSSDSRGLARVVRLSGRRVIWAHFDFASAAGRPASGTVRVVWRGPRGRTASVVKPTTQRITSSYRMNSRTLPSGPWSATLYAGRTALATVRATVR
jgi:hypothetical protein